MKRMTALVLILVLILLAGGCIWNQKADNIFINTYKDILGITQEEISAIEMRSKTMTVLTTDICWKPNRLC